MVTENQHQLHRGYFRAFSKTGSDTDLIFYDTNGQKLKNQSSKSLTTEKFLYETSFLSINEIENWFSKKESIWTPSLFSLKKKLKASSKEYKTLCEFAVATALRQKETIAAYSLIYENFTSTKSGKDSVLLMLEETLAKTHDFTAECLLISVDSPLIFSDNPIIFFDTFGEYLPLWSAGLRAFGGFYFPISQDLIVVISVNKGLLTIPALVYLNNSIQIFQARDFVATDKVLESMLKFELSPFSPDFVLKAKLDCFHIDESIKIPGRTVKESISGLVLSTHTEAFLVFEKYVLPFYVRENSPFRDFTKRLTLEQATALIAKK